VTLEVGPFALGVLLCPVSRANIFVTSELKFMEHGARGISSESRSSANSYLAPLLLTSGVHARPTKPLATAPPIREKAM